MLYRLRTEPAVIVGLLETLLALFMAFGLSLSDEQVGAIMAVAVAVGGLFVRQNVYPAVRVEEELLDAETGLDQE